MKGGFCMEEVIQREKELVYRLAFSQCHQKDQADDIFQNVMYRYMKRKPVFESLEHEKAWFIRVTLNCSKTSLKSFWNAKKVHQTPVAQKPFRFLVSLQEGFLSNVLNPKAVIFYMAFLPQFISHEHSALAQSLFLALIHFTIGTIWQAILVYTIVSANGFIAKKSVRQSLDAVSGIVMIGLGIRLFLEKR